MWRLSYPRPICHGLIETSWGASRGHPRQRISLHAPLPDALLPVHTATRTAALSTTFSTNAYCATSNARTSISTSLRRCANCKPAKAPISTSITMRDHIKVSTIARWRKTTSCSDGGRLHPSGFTLFFPFRCPVIGANHRALPSSFSLARAAVRRPTSGGHMWCYLGATAPSWRERVALERLLGRT